MITDNWFIAVVLILVGIGVVLLFFIPEEECTCSKSMLLEVRVHNLQQDVNALKEEAKDFRQNDIFFRQFTEYITSNYVNMGRKKW